MLSRLTKGEETDRIILDRFIYDDRAEEKDLFIPIFSSITPHHPVKFLLHVMLMCGKYDTELDVRNHITM